MKVIEWLDGRKTYIGIIVGVIYSVCIYFNWLPTNTLVWTIITGWTGVSANIAIHKTQPATTTTTK